MRKLITWHAFEEIEHKHVAYDVLTTCYPRSSYPLRVLGFTITSAVISSYTLNRAARVDRAGPGGDAVLRVVGYSEDCQSVCDGQTCSGCGPQPRTVLLELLLSQRP